MDGAARVCWKLEPQAPGSARVLNGERAQRAHQLFGAARSHRLIDTFVVYMARRTVRLLCDNTATVHVINSGTSRSPAMMAELMIRKAEGRPPPR